MIAPGHFESLLAVLQNPFQQPCSLRCRCTGKLYTEKKGVKLGYIIYPILASKHGYILFFPYSSSASVLGGYHLHPILHLTFGIGNMIIATAASPPTL